MDGCDWSFAENHMRDRHGIEPAWAEEALRDPDALTIRPDPASRSGRSVRTIGFSTSAGCLLMIITVAEGTVTYGVNGWRASVTDMRRYKEDLQ